MSYYFSKVVNLPFEETVQRVTEQLKQEGFGVLTEIDVKATFKKKLDVDFRNYRIFGCLQSPLCISRFTSRAHGWNHAAVQCHRPGS